MRHDRLLTPSASKKLIHDVMSSVDIDVEFHAHNDFGLRSRTRWRMRGGGDFKTGSSGFTR